MFLLYFLNSSADCIMLLPREWCTLMNNLNTSNCVMIISILRKVNQFSKNKSLLEHSIIDKLASYVPIHFFFVENLAIIFFYFTLQHMLPRQPIDLSHLYFFCTNTSVLLPDWWHFMGKKQRWSRSLKDTTKSCQETTHFFKKIWETSGPGFCQS